MVGLAETWFSAFFIASNIGNFSIGVLATLPMLIGSLLQLATPWGMRQMGSYRLWSVIGASLQGCMLLALGAMSAFHAVTFEAAFLLMVVYWGSSLAIGPAWNTWMEFVIPKQVRTKFLSCRMRVCQICLLIAVCIAGTALQSNGILSKQTIFCIMFLGAGFARLISAALLHTHREYPGWTRLGLYPVLDPCRGENFGKTLKQTVPFFVAVQFSVYISGPFFTPFMLRTMGMSYAGFMFLIVLGYLGRILTLRLAGNIARQYGPKPLLMCGAIGIVPLSGLWWFYESFAFLAFVQLAGGIAWGCYELAMSLVFIEQIPRHLRPRVLSVFGTFNGLAMVGGSLLGGTILQILGNQVAGFMVIFIASSVMRGMALFLFPHALFPAGSAAPVVMPECLVPATPTINGRPVMNNFANLSSPGAAEDLEPVHLPERETDSPMFTKAA
jgi:hypothetical protein